MRNDVWIKAIKSLATLGMDYAFIWLLFWVSATGLILLALRETSFMGLILAIHLGLVYGFFLILPLYSKFVHAIYRFAALLADAGEKKIIKLIGDAAIIDKHLTLPS